ncbi:MAG: glutamine synthetase family protein [Geminicoccaceae bacterium]
MAPDGGANRESASIGARFFRDHPELRDVDLLLVDLNGVVRGKRVKGSQAVAGLADPAGAGLAFPSSIYAVDTTGLDTAEAKLAWHRGDPNDLCQLEPETFRLTPWRFGGAQVFCRLVDKKGDAFFLDSRALLARLGRRFADRGLTVTMAFELEFTLIDAALASDRRTPAAAMSEAVDAMAGHLYSIVKLDGAERIMARIRDYADAQRIPLNGLLAEAAPFQYEANLSHRSGPVQAADDLVTLKRIIRNAARLDGSRACFMAKPFMDVPGNGLHVHVGLAQSGRNLFRADEKALRHAIGGLLTTMDEAMLIMAPNANSYRRFEPLSYAPTAPSWGHDNRTTAIRIPSGAPDDIHIEHRLAGSDANPYLVAAAILIALEHGMETAIDPGPPVEGNVYDLLEPSLPLDWARAIDRFEPEGVIGRGLGVEFSTYFRICRQAEHHRFQRFITPIETAWYGDSV